MRTVEEIDADLEHNALMLDNILNTPHNNNLYLAAMILNLSEKLNLVLAAVTSSNKLPGPVDKPEIGG